MIYHKNSEGLTLIELMVVISIMMAMLAIVGGSTIASVDRAKAQVELISIYNLIRMASVRAFASGAGMKVHFSDNKTLAVIEGANPVEKRYEHLQFPEQVLSFNRNGYPDTEVIEVIVRSMKREIEVETLLGSAQFSGE